METIFSRVIQKATVPISVMIERALILKEPQDPNICPED
jgi:hypothetical protein